MPGEREAKDGKQETWGRASDRWSGKQGGARGGTRAARSGQDGATGEARRYDGKQDRERDAVIET